MPQASTAPAAALSRDHIICVDDEEGILTALRQQLVRFDDRCEIDLARSGQEALELMEELELESEDVAMVIADQIMPGMKGVELLEEVHRRRPSSVKILLTGQAGMNAVVKAINSAGLNRFIAKPWDEYDLRLTVTSLLAKFRLSRENRLLVEDLKVKNEELRQLNRDLEARVIARTAELAEANRRLEQLAITDGLTGLLNHRYFHERLASEVARSNRSGQPLSLLMIDVDHFKQYNDRSGHPAGDAVLRGVASILAEGRRLNDVVARYGGEEFAILLVDTPGQAAARLAEYLRSQVEEHPFEHGAEQPGGKLTISLGVATCPAQAKSPAGLLEAADAALYRAKNAGRNRVEAQVEAAP
jgi:diguanylate cyclase (GGDEF)-like protein